jgi:hypothetical protein
MYVYINIYIYMYNDINIPVRTKHYHGPWSERAVHRTVRRAFRISHFTGRVGAERGKTALGMGYRVS